MFRLRELILSAQPVLPQPCLSVSSTARRAFFVRTLFRRFSENLATENFMAVHPVVVHDPVGASQTDEPPGA